MLVALLLWQADDACHAQVSGSTIGVTASYGRVIRFDNVFRECVAIDRWVERGACLFGRQSGFGLRYEWTEESDFLASGRYYKHLGDPFDGPFTVGGCATYASFDDQVVISVAPELGLQARLYLTGRVGVSVLVLCGYDLPVSGGADFDAGRSRLSIALGLDLYDLRIRTWFTGENRRHREIIREYWKSHPQ